MELDIDLYQGLTRTIRITTMSAADIAGASVEVLVGEEGDGVASIDGNIITCTMPAMDNEGCEDYCINLVKDGDLTELLSGTARIHKMLSYGVGSGTHYSGALEVRGEIVGDEFSLISAFGRGDKGEKGDTGDTLEHYDPEKGVRIFDVSKPSGVSNYVAGAWFSSVPLSIGDGSTTNNYSNSLVIYGTDDFISFQLFDKFGDDKKTAFQLEANGEDEKTDNLFNIRIGDDKYGWNDLKRALNICTTGVIEPKSTRQLTLKLGDIGKAFVDVTRPALTTGRPSGESILNYADTSNLFILRSNTVNQTIYSPLSVAGNLLVSGTSEELYSVNLFAVNSETGAVTSKEHISIRTNEPPTDQNHLTTKAYVDNKAPTMHIVTCDCASTELIDFSNFKSGDLIIIKYINSNGASLESHFGVINSNTFYNLVVECDNTEPIYFIDYYLEENNINISGMLYQTEANTPEQYNTRFIK